MSLNHNEAFARVLIDRALADSDWNLLDIHQVRFEFHVATGRIDYLLLDSLGRVLCVLEAKREDADPYDAKPQCRGYSEQKWLNATAELIAEDPQALDQFLRGDLTIFNAGQFVRLGGLPALAQFTARDAVFDALRQTSLVRQSAITATTSCG